MHSGRCRIAVQQRDQEFDLMAQRCEETGRELFVVGCGHAEPEEANQFITMIERKFNRLVRNWNRALDQALPPLWTDPPTALAIAPANCTATRPRAG